MDGGGAHVGSGVPMNVGAGVGCESGVGIWGGAGDRLVMEVRRWWS